MVDALRAQRLPVAYLTLEGEGHGFRKADSVVRTLEAELYFYLRVFGIAVPADLPADRDRESRRMKGGPLPGDMRAQLAACSAEEHAILTLLAIAGEPMGRQRILEHMRALNAPLPAAQWADELARLKAEGLLVDANERGLGLAPAASWPVLDFALDSGLFDVVAGAYGAVSTVRRDWQGHLMLRSYRQGLALLRIALLTRQDIDVVTPLLDACLACHEASYLHPLVDVCARPFTPALIERIHPRLRETVLHILVIHVRSEPALAPAVRACAEGYITRSSPESLLRRALGEHYILCGRLDDALELVAEMTDSPGLFLRSVVQLLRDDVDGGLAGVEAALKQLRRETGKRKATFGGHCAHIAVAALLRSSEPAHRKLADAWLEIETRAVQRPDNAVWFQLGMLHEIRRGTVDAGLFATRSWELSLEPTVFRALIHYWLALPALNSQRARLEDMLAQSELAGFDLWSAPAGRRAGADGPGRLPGARGARGRTAPAPPLARHGALVRRAKSRGSASSMR